MNIDFFKRLLLFLVLLLAQVLVLNHIHLFDCATPLIYVYFVISFQRGYPRWAILVYSFLLGLCGYLLQYAWCGHHIHDYVGFLAALPY